MEVINVLIKPSSSQCNMRCKYCFYFDEANNRNIKSYGFMSYETLDNIIKKTIDNCEKEAIIAFQGGEPTLIGLAFFQKVIELENKYNTKNIKIDNSIQTNGFLISEKWCQFFKDNNFLVGLSIDGTRNTHDKNRIDINGNDTYQNIIHTVNLFNKYDVQYNILTVVNKQTATNIKQIYQDYKKHNFMYQQYIACLPPLNNFNSTQSFTLTPKLYGHFLIDLFNLWYKDLLNNKQPYIRYFENLIGILLGSEPESCEQAGTCATQYVIEADGSVYPCDFYMLDDYKLGNFNNDNYQDFDNKRLEINFIDKSKKVPDKCLKCKYYSLCRNGCQRCRDDNQLNIFCQSYKMFFDACYKDLNKIASIIKNNY